MISQRARPKPKPRRLRLTLASPSARDSRSRNSSIWNPPYSTSFAKQEEIA